jgi:exosortase/archaeosortase family protein
VLSGAALVLAGLWVLLNDERYREAEAWSAAKLVASTVDRGAQMVPGTATFLVGLGTEHAVGLRIDQLCSTGAIVGVASIVTGLLVLFARARPTQALLGLGAMVGLLVVVNSLRIMALSWTVSAWGRAGWFEWLHLYGGAAISMAAVAIGCGLYLRLIRRPVTEPVG